MMTIEELNKKVQASRKKPKSREKIIQRLIKAKIIDEETGYLHSKYFSEDDVKRNMSQDQPLRV